MLKRAAVVLSVVMFAVVSCKATVEGEEKSWTANQAKVKDLEVLYPAFAPALKDQQAKAEAGIKAGRELSDKEAAGKAMREANELISSGWVKTLGGLEAKEKELAGKWFQLHTDSTADGTRDQFREVEAATAGAQAAYKKLIATGAPDAAAADTLVRKAEKDLSEALQGVEGKLREYKEKKEAAAKAAGDAGAGGAAVAVVKGEGGGASVVLTATGDKKIEVIKVIRDATGLGLKESKDIADNPPKTIKEGLSADDAKALQEKLTAAGATVEVK